MAFDDEALAQGASISMRSVIPVSTLVEVLRAPDRPDHQRWRLHAIELLEEMPTGDVISVLARHGLPRPTVARAMLALRARNDELLAWASPGLAALADNRAATELGQ